MHDYTFLSWEYQQIKNVEVAIHTNNTLELKEIEY